MSQYEPTRIRILDNRQNGLDSVQQYVEVGSDTYVGTQDGMEYALLPSSDKTFKLYEVPSDQIFGISSTYPGSYQSNTECDDSFTPSNKFQSVQLVTLRKECTPCRGQGDESGNSILSTPDSTSHHQIPDSPGGNPIQTDGGPHLTYTTLMTKQEQKVDTNLCNTNYIIPASYFQFPSPLQTPLTSKAIKCTKSRQKQLAVPETVSPLCSPIPYRRGRGRGQRKQRQVVYQLRYPFMHSTPTSTFSSPAASIPSASSAVSSSSSSEDQESFEYPRVPNNTPTSGNDDSSQKQKTLNIQWIPQIETQTADYIQMDPRESHNEKERKRRLRIKNACQFMKNLLPRICNKKDNATVFENAVHFIAFMRETVGSTYDMEFLEKTCSTLPYIKTEF